MRTLILSLIFLGLAGYGAKIAYDRFVDSESGFFEKTYAYPDTIMIQNREGSKLRITLLGRSSKYVKFKKKDGREFVYLISSLSDQSQATIMKYPDSGVGDVSLHLSSGDVQLQDVHLTQLEEEVRRMEEEIRRLEAMASATQSKTELRTIERRIEALRKEIAEVEDTISTR